MVLRFGAAFLSLAIFCSADTLTLKNGGVIQGTYLGGDARQVKIAVGDRIDTYSIDEVSMIQFGGGNAPAARTYDTPPPSQDGLVRRQERQERMAQQAAANAGLEIPAGTALVVRLIDPVDSQMDRLGQTYKASIDEPVIGPNGDTVIPRGADVIAKLVEDQQSGKIEGKTVLTLDLTQVQINGRMVDINTSEVSQQSGSRGARSAKVIGGATALGAIIGALAGGGKGAAIGATSGAAVGTGTQVMTKGQRVRIPAETRLTFTLQQPLRG
ncbi:MAG TPA: hypothetical protein VKU01_03155 [Bryobacteraceae bacterium]|nr:hypothetical protein [Bryobacteraceae bacterium]